MQAVRLPVTHLQLLLAIAIALGGGGLAYGLRHLTIELAALLVLACNPAACSRFVREAPRGLKLLVGLTLAVPLLQIVPLPSAMWQALPGRELVIEAYRVAGIDADSWFTYSLDPLRTLTAFCSTLVPACVIIVGYSLPQEHRARLAMTLCAFAGLALVLGAQQLSSANTIGILHGPRPKADVLYATFSNRNSTGMFFLIATLVLIALPWQPGVGRTALASVGLSLFVIAVILTQSRSSIALLAVVLGFAAVRLLAVRGRSLREGLHVPRGAVAVAAALVLGLGVVLAASLAAGGRVADAAERFSQIEVDRLEMWDDAAFVTGRYWPAGAGTGAFDDVFQIDESLEYVSVAKAGRAHNDYLELAIELGPPGLLLLLGWFAWIGLACWRRSRDADRWLAFAAMAGFICIALQSALDYPLRNHAMLCIAAVLIVLLLPRQPANAGK